MSDYRQRRKYPRLPLSMPVKIHVSHPQKPDQLETVEARILDISQGGAFVHGTILVEIGEEVTLELHLDKSTTREGKSLAALAKSLGESVPERSVVKWVRGSAQCGFGVEFISLGPEKKSFVAKVAEAWQQLQSSFQPA